MQHEIMIKIDDARCDLCGACVGVCPENVINLSIYKLSIDHNGCTYCRKCIWICPVRALELVDLTKLSVLE